MNIIHEDVTNEISARILKAEAKKYDCNVIIDYSDEKRICQFSQEDECNDHILKDVANIFKREKL